MGIIPSDVEEQAIQEERLPGAPVTPSAPEHHDKSAKTARSAAIVLGVFALGAALALGFLVLRLVRRQDRRMARLSQQMELLNHRVGGVEQQSQQFAQQASAAAASAKAAAQQRDEAKQSEETSAAQAQSALQAAA